ERHVTPAHLEPRASARNLSRKVERTRRLEEGGGGRGSSGPGSQGGHNRGGVHRAGGGEPERSHGRRGVRWSAIAGMDRSAGTGPSVIQSSLRILPVKGNYIFDRPAHF